MLRLAKRLRLRQRLLLVQAVRLQLVPQLQRLAKQPAQLQLAQLLVQVVRAKQFQVAQLLLNQVALQLLVQAV